MNRQPPEVDVIVTGAGMAGATLACALASEGLKVIILESGKMPEWNFNRYDLRVSAINLASQNTLMALGIWPKIVAMRTSPFYEIEVWDEHNDGRVLFRAVEAGLHNLGHVVENSVVLLALREKLAQQKVQVHYGATVEKFDHNEEKIIVRATNGCSFQAKLLVGADGTHSCVRKLANITVDQRPYFQKAIVAQVTTEKPNKQIAYQRFLSTGPLAFLPITNNQSSIVWSTDERISDDLIRLPDNEFRQQLETAFQNRLGSIISVTQRERFSVSSRHAKTYIGPRVALIGDAAHTVHPLAGLGANQGILDAATLAELVIENVQHQLDFGSRSMLRRYERWRRTENQLILDTLDGLYYWFRARNPTITRLRSLGLNITNNITPIRMLFLKRAVGLTGELPKIAKSASIS